MCHVPLTKPLQGLVVVSRLEYSHQKNMIKKTTHNLQIQSKLTFNSKSLSFFNIHLASPQRRVSLVQWPPEHSQIISDLWQQITIHKNSLYKYLINKKLSYCRGTARCVVSVEILPIATQQWRNYLYDKQVLNKSKLRSWRVKVGRCVINMCT